MKKTLVFGIKSIFFLYGFGLGIDIFQDIIIKYNNSYDEYKEVLKYKPIFNPQKQSIIKEEEITNIEKPKFKDLSGFRERTLERLKNIKDLTYKKIIDLKESIKKDENKINYLDNTMKGYYTEMINAKDVCKKKIENLEKEIHNISNNRKELMDKINKEIKNYEGTYHTYLNQLNSKYDNELKELRDKYKDDINQISQEEHDKSSILYNIDKLTNLIKSYTNKEINLITMNVKKNFHKMEEIREEINIYKLKLDDISKIERELLSEKFNLINTFRSFSLLEDMVDEKAKSLITNLINFKDSKMTKIRTTIAPEMSKIINMGLDSIINEYRSLNTNTLTLKEDVEFINKLETYSLNKWLYVIKSRIARSKDNEEDLNISSQMKEIQKIVSVFNVDFIKNIKVDSVNNLYTNNQLLQEFKNIERNLYFQMFHKNSNPSISNFLYSNALSYILPTFTSKFSPEYHIIKGDDLEIIKKLKAIKFIQYYIIHGDYTTAYSNMKYLISEMNYMKRFEEMLKFMVKNEIIVDLIDSHIN